MFLLLYCAGQIVFDSTRYDALFLPSNGFVSLEQILCAAALAAVLAMYAVRSVKTLGLRPCTLSAGCWRWPASAARAIWKYYVQRHGDRYVLAYGVMSACLLVYVLVTWLTYRSTLRSAILALRRLWRTEV